VPEISQAWLALIGAVLGGSGLKIMESWLNKSKVRDDAASAFRTELRDEVKNLRDELRKVETDLDNWRAKYYELMEQFLKVKAELDAALRNATEDFAQPSEVVSKIPPA